MSDLGRRRKSVLIAGEEIIKIPENALHWRRGSHAAIVSNLPSYRSFLSEPQISLNSGKTTKQQRKNFQQRRRSSVFISDLLCDSSDEEEEIVELSRRRRSRSISLTKGVPDQIELYERRQSIKCITAPIHIKRQFKFQQNSGYNEGRYMHHSNPNSNVYSSSHGEFYNGNTDNYNFQSSADDSRSYHDHIRSLKSPRNYDLRRSQKNSDSFDPPADFLNIGEDNNFRDSGNYDQPKIDDGLYYTGQSYGMYTEERNSDRDMHNKYQSSYGRGYTNDIPQDFPVESFGHQEYNSSDARFIHDSGDQENYYHGESVPENRHIDREIRSEYRRSDKDYYSTEIVPEYVSSGTGTKVNSFKYVETPEEFYEPIDEIPDYDYEDSVPQGNTDRQNLIQEVGGQRNMLDMDQRHAGLSNTAFEDGFSVSQDLTVPEVYENETHLNYNKGAGNSKILDDGSKTYVFRKKTVPADTVSRRSTLKRKSVIPEGYVPSHRENVLTLKDKIKLLRKQNTLHGVVDVFREKILDNAEIDLQGFAGWRHKQSEKWNDFKQHLKNIAAVLEPWAGSFKTIEGRFGTAIMNYFRFIRWLMFMNLYMVIIMLCAILVPHYILENTVFNETDITKTCTEEYNKHVKNFTENENIGSQVLDVLQGTGWMEQTVLFYGVYQNKTILDHDTTYNMSLAYLLAMGSCFCISFVLIVRNTGKGLKQGVMNKDSTVNQFVNKVFCGGWDFCISEQKAAKRRHKNFLQELQGDLETQRLIWRKQSRTLKDKCTLYSIRIVINVFVVAALSGSLYLIFFTNAQMLELQNRSKELDPVVQALIQYLPSITITLLNVIVPVIFNKIVLFEDYTPTFEIRITLLRVILLRLASLGILIGSLYRTIAVQESGFISQCGNNRWNLTEDVNLTMDFKTTIKCWETYVGQQIYKLIIMDFLVGVISVILMEFPRRFIYQKFHKKSKLVKMIGQQEFDLPKVVLDIVYSQTLCWMGMFFCPLTPILGFLKCFIFFYVRKVSLLQNCVQPVRPYRTSRSNSLFAAVLFLSFLLSTVPLAYLVSSFQPSQSCGPFRQYEGEDYVFFGTVTNLIETWPSTARDVFWVIGSSAFMVPAILVVCSVMYGYWASKGASQRQAELLQEELTQEGRDKQFLVAQVNEILQHLESTQS